MPVDVTTPSDTEIRVVRTFDAPRQLIFDCHTRPELVRRWLLGPPGWSMPVCEIDLTIGGKYRYRWRNDETGHEFGTAGEHLEIVAAERLVTTERMEGFMGEAVNAMTLEERGGRTTMTLTIRHGSKEARDQALATGMTDGMEASYARIDAIAAEAAA